MPNPWNPVVAAENGRGFVVPRRKPPTDARPVIESRWVEINTPSSQTNRPLEGTGSKKRPSLDALTALRFFAALAIVVYHLKPVMPVFCGGLAKFPLFDRLSIGVEFFFVLSGFILHYNYGSRAGLDLKEFYVKRAVRIYPLHILTAGTWCALFFASWGAPFRDKLWSGLANLTLTQSLVPGMLFCLGYNAVSWSLSNEAFFYAWFPLLRRKAVSLSVLSVVAAYLVAAYMTGLQPVVAEYFPNVEYFCPLIRVAEFCAGILAAQSFKAETRLTNATVWEAGVLAALIFQVCFQHVDYSLNQLSNLFMFTAAVWIFAHQQGAISKWLANQTTLVLLGEASFSLYMWHHMVLSVGNAHLPHGMWAPAAVFLAVGTSIVVSVFSFRYFENPARRILTWLILSPASEQSRSPVEHLVDADSLKGPATSEMGDDAPSIRLRPLSEAA